jgi:hypothetical protein
MRHLLTQSISLCEIFISAKTTQLKYREKGHTNVCQVRIKNSILLESDLKLPFVYAKGARATDLL